MPIVSRNEGASTRYGRRAFCLAYFSPDSERVVRGGWVDVAVLISVTDRSSVVGNFEGTLFRDSA